MRKKIGSVTYDTDAAWVKIVGTDVYAVTDENRHCEEILYRTAQGNWFIIGTGGVLSRYNGDVPVLIAITPSEARLWLYHHSTPEIRATYFGGNEAP